MFKNPLSLIEIKDFRNIAYSSLIPSSGLNCFFGENAAGKTNLLEALYFLSTQDSFRGFVAPKNLISFDSILGSAVLTFTFDQKLSFRFKSIIGSLEVEWFLENKEKKFQKISLKKYLEQQVPSCFFLGPQESFLFFQQRDFRYSWFNRNFSVLSGGYKQELIELHKLLKMRNKLLKMGIKTTTEIVAIDKIRAIKMAQIKYQRKEFLKELSPFVSLNMKTIFGRDLNLLLELKTNIIPDSTEEIFNLISTERKNDYERGITLFGHHRDDYILLLDQLDAKFYASTGQQKALYYSLWFAYIQLFMYKQRRAPFVLLDDISGELDSVRWENFIALLRQLNLQVFITTANKLIQQQLLNFSDSKAFLVKNGQVLNIL